MATTEKVLREEGNIQLIQRTDADGRILYSVNAPDTQADGAASDDKSVAEDAYEMALYWAAAE